MSHPSTKKKNVFELIRDGELTRETLTQEGLETIKKWLDIDEDFSSVLDAKTQEIVNETLVEIFTNPETQKIITEATQEFYNKSDKENPKHIMSFLEGLKKDLQKLLIKTLEIKGEIKENTREIFKNAESFVKETTEEGMNAYDKIMHDFKHKIK